LGTKAEMLFQVDEIDHAPSVSWLTPEDVHWLEVYSLAEGFRAAAAAGPVSPRTGQGAMPRLIVKHGLALKAACEGPHQLSPVDRDRLAAVITAAAEAACEHFPAHCPRDRIRLGFQAYGQMVALWANRPADRPPGWIDKAWAAAQEMRQECHAMAIIAELQQWWRHGAPLSNE